MPSVHHITTMRVLRLRVPSIHFVMTQTILFSLGTCLISPCSLHHCGERALQSKSIQVFCNFMGSFFFSRSPATNNITIKATRDRSHLVAGSVMHSIAENVAQTIVLLIMSAAQHGLNRVGGRIGLEVCQSRAVRSSSGREQGDSGRAKCHSK